MLLIVPHFCFALAKLSSSTIKQATIAVKFVFFSESRGFLNEAHKSPASMWILDSIDVYASGDHEPIFSNVKVKVSL